MRKLDISELQRPTVEAYRKIRKLPYVVVMDNVRSMHNVGAIFRTCDAFLVLKVFLTGITARPPHREIQKTALGSAESVDWEYVKEVKDVVKMLRSEGYRITGIEQTDQSISLADHKVDLKIPHALILGNEVDGLSGEIVNELDEALEIPQSGTKHSLNVSVTGGIVLWNYFQAFLKDQG